MHARWDPCATKWQVRGAEPRREGDGCSSSGVWCTRRFFIYIGNAACIDMGKGMRMDVSRGTPSGTAPVSFSFSSHSLKSTQGSCSSPSPQPHGVTRHIAKTVSRPRWPCDRSCAWCARSRSAAAPFRFRQAFNSFARSSFGVLVSAPVPATGKEGIGGSCRRGRSDRGASP